MSRELNRGRHGRRSALFVLSALGTVLVSAAVPGAARAGADEQPKSESLWSGILETLNLRAKPGSMPDFVKATHPDPSKLDFIPTSTPHPTRSIPVKSSTEVEAAKQTLDAARQAQMIRSAAPAVPVPVPATAKHIPAKPKRTATQN